MGTDLRARLRSADPVVAPGAWDALSARLIQQAGFDAVFLTGSGVSFATLAQPDVGLVTQTEMVKRASEVADAIEIPLIVDGDTGHGNAVNVVRSVREFERAGASALMLEDQAFPKRCGHLEGTKDLVSAREAALKIRAACEARRRDLVIIGRTDARADLGLREAIERARLYREAGADVVFVEAPRSVEELREVATQLPGVPLMANMVEGGVTPELSTAELRALGYVLVIRPGTLIRAYVHHARAVLDELRAERPIELTSFAELNAIVRLDAVRDLERRFLPSKGDS